MKLRFIPRADTLTRLPEHRIQGAPARYIGRELRMENGAPSWPASREPFECNASIDESKMGGYLRRLCQRDGDLMPYDKETADYCGVRFKAMQWDNGVWREAQPELPKQQSGKPNEAQFRQKGK